VHRPHLTFDATDQQCCILYVNSPAWLQVCRCLCCILCFSLLRVGMSPEFGLPSILTCTFLRILRVCRCAGVVMLVSLLQLCTSSPLLRDQLPRLQATFTGLLGDSNDLTQVRVVAGGGGVKFIITCHQLMPKLQCTGCTKSQYWLSHPPCNTNTTCILSIMGFGHSDELGY
jgi:hypothetical protein